MAAESLLDELRIKALEDVANCGVGRCTLPAQTEGGVQLAAVHRDERFDGTIRVAAGDRGEDRKQQNVGQLIELSFGPARRGSGISLSKPINWSNDRKAAS
jgi:hypothetical protein